MREFVVLTRADTLAVFRQWADVIEKEGAHPDPNPENRAEFFFDLSDKYLTEKKAK